MLKECHQKDNRMANVAAWELCGTNVALTVALTVAFKMLSYLEPAGVGVWVLWKARSRQCEIP